MLAVRCCPVDRMPASVKLAEDTKRSRHSWLFFVSFALRCFYDLGIRRCKPGAIKWP